MNRKEMKDSLHKDVCEVKFTKVDGTERVMFCTLNTDMIPRHMMPKDGGHGAQKENEDIIRAFDVVLEGWRSFRVQSVIEFKDNSYPTVEPEPEEVQPVVVEEVKPSPTKTRKQKKRVQPISIEESEND